mgnify:CR=1 FL=1
MKEVEVGKIVFKIPQKITGKQTHLFRGYISNIFRDREIIHNHDLKNGECKYHYPLIQYKIIKGNPIIIGIGSEALSILQSILCQVRQIKLQKRLFKITKSTMQVSWQAIGISQEYRTYELISPWLALNSKNYKKYNNASVSEKKNILIRCLVGNILSMSKYLGYTVNEKIIPEISLVSRVVNLKGHKMTGFYGKYKVNFYLPDYIGIGKSCSRGYGCCKDITE